MFVITIKQFIEMECLDLKNNMINQFKFLMRFSIVGPRLKVRNKSQPLKVKAKLKCLNVRNFQNGHRAVNKYKLFVQGQKYT